MDNQGHPVYGVEPRLQWHVAPEHQTMSTRATEIGGLVGRSVHAPHPTPQQVLNLFHPLHLSLWTLSYLQPELQPPSSGWASTVAEKWPSSSTRIRLGLASTTTAIACPDRRQREHRSLLPFRKKVPCGRVNSLLTRRQDTVIYNAQPSYRRMNIAKQKLIQVSSKFTMFWWAMFIASLGLMQPKGLGLDNMGGKQLGKMRGGLEWKMG